ncbi:hypothetical protein QFC22_000795 [Naganishia vaughanmartiniae]|uniref:Uncharacterized protein n=1 Tax=Naganishia vaughanmartiniae TaxID=1424756 RepID=A0ACC2XJG9_9TREE|nr:hypothetical protein QFC22_000795 [Naganishia vaughanmartiniae]
MKFNFTVPLLATLLALGSISASLAQPPPSPPESVPEPTAARRSNVERRNTQTGLGLKKSSSSDSKIAKNVLESTGEGYCSPSGPIENTLCAYETIESLNKDLYPTLHDLVTSDFFRHYKVDLFRECPFWYENGFCMNRDCGVETADEEYIPEKWRTKALSQVHVTDEQDSQPGCDVHAEDFCYIDSESPSSEGQYIDLMLNPERFTGYAGESAHKVWRAIYEENCFGLTEKVGIEYDADGSLNGGGGSGITQLKSGLGGQTSIMDPRKQQGFGTDMRRGAARAEECLEKRIYYRIISGLHASISIHICNEYLDQETGEWGPNLQCFITRLASHPDRLSNVYFNAVLLLRAVARAAPYLEAYDIETAKNASDLIGLEKDHKAREEMNRVLDMAKMSGAGWFDEKALFRGDDAVELRDQFKYNFRNVSRILDCTGCDKCRLWGKLQISGIGTALKILFELDDKAFDPKRNPNLLQRSEIVALVNTLHRISESLQSVEVFRKLYAKTQDEGQAKAAAAIEEAKAEAAKRPQRTKQSSRPLWYPIREYYHSLRTTCQRSFWMCVQQIQRGPIGFLIRLFGFAQEPLTYGSKKVEL